MFLKFRYRVHHKVTVTVPFGLALPQSLSEILLSWTDNLPGCSKSIVKLSNGFPTTPHHTETPLGQHFPYPFRFQKITLRVHSKQIFSVSLQLAFNLLSTCFQFFRF